MQTKTRARISPRILEKAGNIQPVYLRPPEYARKYSIGLNSVTELVKAERVEFFRVGRALRIADAPPRAEG